MNKDQYEKATYILEKISNLETFNKRLKKKYDEIKDTDEELKELFLITSNVLSTLKGIYNQEFETL